MISREWIVRLTQGNFVKTIANRSYWWGARRAIVLMTHFINHNASADTTAENTTNRRTKSWFNTSSNLSSQFDACCNLQSKRIDKVDRISPDIGIEILWIILQIPFTPFAFIRHKKQRNAHAQSEFLVGHIRSAVWASHSI